MDPSPTIRVLLIEDDPGDALLLRGALAEHDDVIDLQHVTTLDAAAERGASESFDLALLDLGLGPTEGLATFQRYMDLVPDLPVVIMTHLSGDDVALEAVACGAQDFVVKGTVDELQLARTIRHAAQRGQLMAEVEQLAERHRVLADLGRTAAGNPPLVDLFTRAAELIRSSLGTRLAMVVQRRGDGRYVIRSCDGATGLENELLPVLLVSQLPRAGDEPMLVEDLRELDLSEACDAPEALKAGRDLLVLPLRGAAWSGAIALLDTPEGGTYAGTMDFLRAVQTLLEEALRRAAAEADLEERVKELSAIAAIGRLVQEEGPREGMLRAVADSLAKAMQFPHHAVACVEVDDCVVVSDGRRPGMAEQLVAPLVCDGRRRGQVAVGHRTIQGFLPTFEQQLVDAAAETLSLWLESQMGTSAAPTAAPATAPGGLLPCIAARTATTSTTPRTAASASRSPPRRWGPSKSSSIIR